jgi:hypothetical protein
VFSFSSKLNLIPPIPIFPKRHPRRSTTL